MGEIVAVRERDAVPEGRAEWLADAVGEGEGVAVGLDRREAEGVRETVAVGVWVAVPQRQAWATGRGRVDGLFSASNCFFPLRLSIFGPGSRTSPGKKKSVLTCLPFGSWAQRKSADGSMLQGTRMKQLKKRFQKIFNKYEK